LINVCRRRGRACCDRGGAPAEGVVLTSEGLGVERVRTANGQVAGRVVQQAQRPAPVGARLVAGSLTVRRWSSAAPGWQRLGVIDSSAAMEAGVCWPLQHRTPCDAGAQVVAVAGRGLKACAVKSWWSRAPGVDILAALAAGLWVVDRARRCLAARSRFWRTAAMRKYGQNYGTFVVYLRRFYRVSFN